MSGLSDLSAKITFSFDIPKKMKFLFPILIFIPICKDKKSIKVTNLGLKSLLFLLLPLYS